MGYRDAAQARLCMDKKNREAFELAGYECPQAKKEKKAASASDSVTTNVSNSEYSGNDPIVKARLGLK